MFIGNDRNIGLTNVRFSSVYGLLANFQFRQKHGNELHLKLSEGDNDDDV